MSKRTHARELVLKCLYAFESLDGDAESVFKQTCADSHLDGTAFEFVSNLFFKIVGEITEIDKKISASAQNWDIKRLAIVDKNIIRIAVCELFFFPDIPAKVSINEAIELAKKYSTLDSASFVNGILDNIYKENAVELENGASA
ncbi:MAG: transcription antitermination factor NusB [Candidatus Zixiibacteriota bacterium]